MMGMRVRGRGRGRGRVWRGGLGGLLGMGWMELGSDFVRFVCYFQAHLVLLLTSSPKISQSNPQSDLIYPIIPTPKI